MWAYNLKKTISSETYFHFSPQKTVILSNKEMEGIQMSLGLPVAQFTQFSGPGYQVSGASGQSQGLSSRLPPQTGYTMSGHSVVQQPPQQQYMQPRSSLNVDPRAVPHPAPGGTPAAVPSTIPASATTLAINVPYAVPYPTPSAIPPRPTSQSPHLAPTPSTTPDAVPSYVGTSSVPAGAVNPVTNILQKCLSARNVEQIQPLVCQVAMDRDDRVARLSSVLFKSVSDIRSLTEQIEQRKKRNQSSVEAGCQLLDLMGYLSDQVKQTADTVEDMLKNMDKAQAARAAVTGTISQMTEQIKNTNTVINQLIDESGNLTERNQRLKKECEKCKDEGEQFLKKLEELKDSYENLKSESNRTEFEISSLEKNQRALSHKLSESQFGVESLTREFNFLSVQLNEVGNKLNLKTDKDSYSTRACEGLVDEHSQGVEGDQKVKFEPSGYGYDSTIQELEEEVDNLNNDFHYCESQNKDLEKNARLKERELSCLEIRFSELSKSASDSGKEIQLLENRLKASEIESEETRCKLMKSESMGDEETESLNIAIMKEKQLMDEASDKSKMLDANLAKARSNWDELSTLLSEDIENKRGDVDQLNVEIKKAEDELDEMKAKSQASRMLREQFLDNLKDHLKSEKEKELLSLDSGSLKGGIDGEDLNKNAEDLIQRQWDLIDTYVHLLDTSAGSLKKLCAEHEELSNVGKRARASIAGALLNLDGGVDDANKILPMLGLTPEEKHKNEHKQNVQQLSLRLKDVLSKEHSRLTAVHGSMEVFGHGGFSMLEAPAMKDDGASSQNVSRSASMSSVCSGDKYFAADSVSLYEDQQPVADSQRYQSMRDLTAVGSEYGDPLAPVQGKVLTESSGADTQTNTSSSGEDPEVHGWEEKAEKLSALEEEEGSASDTNYSED